MTIVYALVSRQKTVLAEYTATSGRAAFGVLFQNCVMTRSERIEVHIRARRIRVLLSFTLVVSFCHHAILTPVYSSEKATGNFPTVTRVLLSKIPTNDGSMSYVYDSHIFHYVVENGICFLCMSDELRKHRIPYAFLQDMKQRFVARYGTEIPQTAIAFSMNDEFSRVIQERMEFYNSDEADLTVDNIGAVKSQIEDVKGVMVENIEKVLERGEKIELLVDKTDRLNQQAFKFESSSRNLRRTLYWRKMRGYIIAGAAITIILYLAMVSLCGGFAMNKCFAHHD